MADYTNQFYDNYQQDDYLSIGPCKDHPSTKLNVPYATTGHYSKVVMVSEYFVYYNN